MRVACVLIPLILWEGVYEQYRSALRETFVLAAGRVSRKEGTVNVVVERLGTLGDLRRKQGKEPSVAGTETMQQPRPYFR